MIDDPLLPFTNYVKLLASVPQYLTSAIRYTQDKTGGKAIFMNGTKSYALMVKTFHNLKVNFHQVKNKFETPSRFIIRGLPQMTLEQELKDELARLGFVVNGF